MKTYLLIRRSVAWIVQVDHLHRLNGNQISIVEALEATAASFALEKHNGLVKSTRPHFINVYGMNPNVFQVM